MTDPNKDLGQWLLRERLGIKEGEILTIKKLEEKNIDSVIVYKYSNSNFQISLNPFKKTNIKRDFN